MSILSILDLWKSTAPNEHLLPACWKMDSARECKLIANRYAVHCVEYKRAKNMKAEEQDGGGK